jgi:tetratricopeptide (TPR) repeat protein
MYQVSLRNHLYKAAFVVGIVIFLLAFTLGFFRSIILHAHIPPVGVTYRTGIESLKEQRKHNALASQLRLALDLDLDRSDQFDLHYELGMLLDSQGRQMEAIHHLHRSVQLNSDHLEALNHLAWALATCPDPKLNPSLRLEAVKLARRASERLANKHPAVLDTLAASHAAVGQYELAVTTAESALKLAARQQAHRLAEEIRARLQLYKASKPFYREPQPLGKDRPNGASSNQ